MITFKKIPTGQYFARNPIRFVVETNKYVVSAKIVPALNIVFTNSGPADGDSMVIVTDGISIEIGFINTVPPAGDQTNYRIKQSGQALNNWVAQFAAALKNNFLLMSYFEVSSALNAIQLDSKRGLTVSVVNNAQNTLPFASNTSTDAVYRPNFKIYADVSVEENYRAGDFKYVGTLVHEPDSDSRTWFDVAPLVLPYLTYDLPPQSWPVNIARICSGMSKRYNVVVREEYGDVPVIQSASGADNSRGGWAQRGGFAPEHFDINYSLDVPSGSGKQIFQSWCPGPKPTTKTQPEYLYFRYLNASIARVKLTLNFDDGTSSTHNNHVANLLLNAEIGDVVYFKTDYESLGIAALFSGSKKVTTYKVELTDSSNTVLYAGFTYRVDHRHYEYARYLLFQNSWGAMESVLIKNSVARKENVEREFSTKVLEYDYSDLDGELIEFDSNSNTVYDTSTGFYTRQYIEYLRDLLRNSRYIFGINSNGYYRANLLPGGYEISRDEQNLYSLNLSFALSFNKKTYSNKTAVDAATQTLSASGGGTKAVILPGG
jgi:hypothetical protein